MNKLYSLSIALCLLLIGSIQTNLFAQPANDAVCNATFLAFSDTCFDMAAPNGDNTMATLEMGEPEPACYAAPTVSVWYKIVAPASGYIELSTDFAITAPTPNTDTEIALFAVPGGDCSVFTDFVELGCAQDIGFGNYLSTLSEVFVTPGDTLYVSVSGWQGAMGSFCLDAIELPAPVFPDNDSICNATVLSVDDFCTGGSLPNGNNTFAGAEMGEPIGTCYVGGANSVWFKFAAPASGIIDVSTDFTITSTDPNTDTEVALYTLPGGDCSVFTDFVEIGCSQDVDIANGNFLSKISGAVVTPGDTLYISVSGWNGAEGEFCLDVISSPINDSICDASLLTVTDFCTAGAFTNGDNSLASSETGEPVPSCFIGGTNSVWYKFEAPASGIIDVSTNFAITSPGINTDTEVALYQLPGGDCTDFTDLVEIGCSQDVSAANLLSTISGVTVTPGDTLYISVSGSNGTEGTFCIDVISRPPNDSAINAIALPVDGSLNSFFSVDATVEAGEEAAVAPPNSTEGLGNGSGFIGWNEATVTNTIWFTFIAPPSGAVSIDLCGMGMNGTDFDSQVAVYDVGDSSDYSTFSFHSANDDWIDCFPQFAGGPLPNNAPSIWASYLESNCLTPGKKYWLLVDGYAAGTVGNAGIVISEIAVAPLALGLTGSNPASCPGVGGGGGSLLVNVTGGGFPYDIAWSNGATDTLELSDLDAGTYTLNLTDACDSVLTTDIIVPELSDFYPSLAADAGGGAASDASICFGDSVVLGGAPAGTGGNPNLGPNLYFTEYAAGGDNLLNAMIDAPHQSIDTGSDTSYVGALRSMDFGPDGILFSFSAVTNELVAINENTTPTSFFGLGTMTPLPNHIFVNLMHDESTGTLYAMSFDGVNLGTQLYTVDAQTAVATPTIAVNLPVAVAAAFDSSGTLYMIDLFDNSLYTVDLATGAPTLVGSTGIDIQFIDVNDMDFDPTTDRLYLSAYTASGNELRVVNTTTGIATEINSVGIGGATGRFIGGLALAPTDESTRYDYAWTPALALIPATGDVANPISNTPISTDYTLTVTDACGTTATDLISVTVNDDPSVSVTSTPDNGTGNGTVTAMGTGGSGTYIFTWTDAMGDTISMDATVTDLDSGMYTVMVEDENGCSTSDMIAIGSNVSIDQLLAAGINSISAYPNPSHGIVTIKVELVNIDDMSVSITDLRGKAVWKSAAHTTSMFEEMVNLSDLAGGMYLIQVETSKGNSVQRLTLN